MSIKLDIPQRGVIDLQHAVFDVDGTLAVDGVAIPGVVERLQEISEHISIHLLTSGTYDTLAELERVLGFPIREVHHGDEKMRYVNQLDPDHVIAFGNGLSDLSMLRLAKIGIAVMDEEGIAARVFNNADLIVNGTTNALDLLLNPKRLVSALRG